LDASATNIATGTAHVFCFKLALDVTTIAAICTYPLDYEPTHNYSTCSHEVGLCSKV